MEKRRIYAIGESLLDIIFDQGIPVAAKAGGAMLNTAVSLGRLRENITLISELGQDEAANLILDFLEKSGVNTDYIYRYTNGKTALALAFLDDNKNSTYSFYKLYPGKRLQVEIPEFGENDLFLFGSFYALKNEIREKLLQIVLNARNNNTFILYDPNIRKPHKHEIPGMTDLVLKNISMADIVRGSDEDFDTIFDLEDPHRIYSEIIKPGGCGHLIYTSSNKGVWLFTPELQKFYPVPVVEPVSTIGAGDSFNAGLIYGISKEKINRSRLTEIKEKQWDDIVETAISFGTEACLSYENYISMDFITRLLNRD